jgi:hypothetical protein
MKVRRVCVGVSLVVLAANLGIVAVLAASQSEAPPSKTDLVALDPFPESARHDAALLQAELDRRLEEWSATTLPSSLTPPQLGDAILTIWHAMSGLPEGEEWWLQSKQLGARVHLICQRLPLDDGLRADFCPSG